MNTVTRRSLFAAGGAAVAGVAGGWFVFRKRYPHSAYDDILAQIPDRDDAANGKLVEFKGWVLPESLALACALAAKAA